MLVHHASWFLVAAFGISILYEFYRAIFKTGVTKWDNKRSFFLQNLPIYLVLFILAVMLRLEWEWVIWLVLILTIGLIGVSIFYYNPVIMIARKPALIDWIEDLVYTGLLFVAAAFLVYHLAGITLAP